MKALEHLYRRRIPDQHVYHPDQARELALLSRSLNRQLALLTDRKGKVKMVLVGNASSILIPELEPVGSGRLSGLRLLHTHLDPGGLSREDLMDMLFLRFDAAIALTVNPNGEPMHWHGAWVLPPDPPQSLLAIPALQTSDSCHVGRPRIWHDTACDFNGLAEDIEKALGRRDLDASNGENALLISVSTESQAVQERNLDELAELAKSAGVGVAGRLSQRISHPDPRYILGKGKLLELEVQALNARADLLIFDGELTPAQLNNLAEITERRVIDRTQLILDIFAQHAVTAAGRLQVELAQLAYGQPRLAGKRKALDRLAGGIGGRGPGETRLETDRRKSRERMAILRKELQKLQKQRQLGRRKRERNGVPVACLVGYTNVGKTSLLNKLTSSNVLAADKLFATLDPTTRRLRFPREREVTIADTVGFIRNLPRELTEAFRATLEELQAADVLIHVADASHWQLERQLASVENILEELNLHHIPTILVLNKWDEVQANSGADLLEAYPNAIPVSAHSGFGLAALLVRIEQELFLNKLAGNNS